MTLPAIPTVEIRLGTGPAWGDVLVLGDLADGILGTNILGTESTVVANVSSDVQRISIRRGRDRVFDNFTAGTATIQFLDRTGDWNPNNPAGAYYGRILPMRQVKIYTTYQSVSYDLHTGFITSWDWAWADQAAGYAIVTIQTVDAFRLLQLSQITTVTGAANKDLPGERIGLILDEINWPSDLRDIDTGDTELEGDPGDARTALSAIQVIEQSDLGAFFVDPAGVLTYFDRIELSAKASSTATRFADDGTGIPYQDLDLNLDDTQLANSVTFTRLSGQPQTAQDQDSIDQYFLRSYSRTGLMMETNALALARAQTFLNRSKDTNLRVDSITLDLSSDTSRVEPALSLDVADPIVIQRTMAAGTDITVRVVVNGVNHDITPDRWTTTFSTGAPLSTAFVLGSINFGILGTNTL